VSVPDTFVRVARKRGTGALLRTLAAGRIYGFSGINLAATSGGIMPLA
jgi:hypothetical protein